MADFFSIIPSSIYGAAILTSNYRDESEVKNLPFRGRQKVAKIVNDRQAPKIPCSKYKSELSTLAKFYSLSY